MQEYSDEKSKISSKLKRTGKITPEKTKKLPKEHFEAVYAEFSENMANKICILISA